MVYDENVNSLNNMLLDGGERIKFLQTFLDEE